MRFAREAQPLRSHAGSVLNCRWSRRGCALARGCSRVCVPLRRGTAANVRFDGPPQPVLLCMQDSNPRPVPRVAQGRSAPRLASWLVCDRRPATGGRAVCRCPCMARRARLRAPTGAGSGIGGLARASRFLGGVRSRRAWEKRLAMRTALEVIDNRRRNCKTGLALFDRQRRAAPMRVLRFGRKVLREARLREPVAVRTRNPSRHQ